MLAADESNTTQEALASTEAGMWKQAIDGEMQSSFENYTFEIVDSPPERKVMKNRGVVTIRDNQHGEIRYKARLLAKGLSQEAGIDFDDTSALVAKFVQSVSSVPGTENSK
ncbi:hypothetical protein JTB14_011568 [Gonioctena quinquepunctata]|nr:hypothetical protein JTB14_011568 [Gonioctena quinquepunctata]